MKLPVFNENDAVFSGVCLDQITVQFPKYPLQGRVIKDIRNGYKQIGGDMKNLPKLLRYVGENTDFTIEIQYLRYNPEKTHTPIAIRFFYLEVKFQKFRWVRRYHR